MRLNCYVQNIKSDEEMGLPIPKMNFKKFEKFNSGRLSARYEVKPETSSEETGLPVPKFTFQKKQRGTSQWSQSEN